MESKIPLPTDNIYKFYALFGLLVMLTAAVMFFVSHENYNKTAFDLYIPIETLKQQKDLTVDKQKELKLLDRKLFIAESDQNFKLWVFAILLFVGAGVTSHGFYNWHKVIQPREDKLIDLQIRKLECELKAQEKESMQEQYGEN